MKAEMELRWLPKTEFGTKNPISVTIKDVQNVPNGKFTDKILYVEYDKILYKYQVWGDNWNKLIKAYGSDTDAWINKIVSIMKQETIEGAVQYVVTPNV